MDYEEQDTFILNWDALFFLSLSLSLLTICLCRNFLHNEREY